MANPADPTSINGVAVPLADNWVLTPEEQAITRNTIDTYNTSIAQLAAEFDIPLVDVNMMLETLNSTGFALADGSLVTSALDRWCFSLDGVSLISRGYAIVANAFIEAINGKYDQTYQA